MKPIDVLTRFECKFTPEPNTGCWLWTGALDQQGYGWFCLSRPSRMIRAHRFAYECYIGPIPAGLCVLHRCDVPSCVNPDHLFLGTHADNMADMTAKGRGRPPFQRGESNSQAKLTAEQVVAIRADTRGLGPIAAEYGIAKSAICGIRKRKRWMHVL